MNNEIINKDDLQVSKNQKIRSTNFLNYSKVDIKKPHGFLGDVCELINSTAVRDMPEGTLANALHFLGLLAIKNDVQDCFGNKINLITMVIGLSAAGKENGQKHLKQFASDIEVISQVKDAPRSDKDLVLNAINNNGKNLYLIDEAQKLFQTMGDKKNTFSSNIESNLLSMSTTNLFLLSGTTIRELEQTYQKTIGSLEKKLEKLEEKATSDPDLERQLKAGIETAKAKITMLNNGIHNPIVNMALSSTPGKIDDAINQDSVESGLIGRSLIFRASERRGKLNFDKIENKQDTNQLYMSILHQSTKVLEKTNIKIEDDAKKILREIGYFYDDIEFIDNDYLGATYARLYERVVSLSSLLAMTTGTITKQDVLYAHAVCCSHIENCEYLTSMSIVKTDYYGKMENRDLDLLKMVKERILSILAKQDSSATFASVLKQKVFKSAKVKKVLVTAADQNKYFKAALDSLSTSNEIIMDSKSIRLADK